MKNLNDSNSNKRRLAAALLTIVMTSTAVKMSIDALEGEKSSASNIEESVDVQYYLPEGFTLVEKDGVYYGERTIKIQELVYATKNGVEDQVYYTVPNGYVLVEIEGRFYGVKTTESKEYILASTIIENTQRAHK